MWYNLLYFPSRTYSTGRSNRPVVAAALKTAQRKVKEKKEERGGVVAAAGGVVSPAYSPPEELHVVVSFLADNSLVFS